MVIEQPILHDRLLVKGIFEQMKSNNINKQLITEVETNGWTNTADLTTNGWTGTFTDHDADTGEEYPSDYSISANETWAS